MDLLANIPDDGVIGGAVGGAVAVIILIITVSVFVVRRKRKQR